MEVYGWVPFTRLVESDDAAALAEILSRNREFMAPTEPERGESFYTVEGQSQIIGVASSRTAFASTATPPDI
jgi:hypothetical protein